MPYLRFTRDRHGYENTFLVHTVQRRGRQQPRVLYWFRSPPNIKVGRAALDEDAIRELESRHPDIKFAWSRILQTRPEEGQDEEPVFERRREPRTHRPQQERPTPQARRPMRQPSGSPEPPPRRSDQNDGPPPTPDDERTDWLAPALAPSAAQQVLGPEGLARLRGRYAEVQTRISQHAAAREAQGEGHLDVAPLDALRALAERLNPDAWVTADEVRRGAADFDQVLGELRRRMGWPRRRTRGGRKHRVARGAEDRTVDTNGESNVPSDLERPGPETGGSSS